MPKLTMNPEPVITVEDRVAWLPFVGDTVIPSAFWAAFRYEAHETLIRVVAPHGRPFVSEVRVISIWPRWPSTSKLLAGTRLPALLTAALSAAQEPNNGRAITNMAGLAKVPAGEGVWVSRSVARRSDRTQSAPKRLRRTVEEFDEDLRTFAVAYSEAQRSAGLLKVKDHACRIAGIAIGSYGRYRAEALKRGLISN